MMIFSKKGMKWADNVKFTIGEIHQNGEIHQFSPFKVKTGFWRPTAPTALGVTEYHWFGRSVGVKSQDLGDF